MVGLVLGLGGSLAGVRALRSLLYQVDVYDPAVFAVGAMLLAVIALAACGFGFEISCKHCGGSTTEGRVRPILVVLVAPLPKGASRHEDKPKSGVRQRRGAIRHKSPWTARTPLALGITASSKYVIGIARQGGDITELIRLVRAASGNRHLLFAVQRSSCRGERSPPQAAARHHSRCADEIGDSSR